MAQHRRVSLIMMAVTAIGCHALPAQTAVEPTAYSVTVQFQATGTAQRKTQRLGSLILVDQTAEPSAPQRILYNLSTRQSLSWNPDDLSGPCEHKPFLPQEWLDPFAGGPDLAMKNVHHAGVQTIHGIAADILETSEHPDSTFRVWVDPRTGLMLKAELVSKKLGQTIPFFEVTEISLTPPPQSIFRIPARCSGTQTSPHP